MNTDAPRCETCPIYSPLVRCADVLGRLAAPAVEAAEIRQAQSEVASEMLADASEVVLQTSLDPDSKDRADALDLLDAGVTGAWSDFMSNSAAAHQRRTAAAFMEQETSAGLEPEAARALLLQSGAEFATTNVKALEQNCPGQTKPEKCAALAQHNAMPKLP